MTNTNAAILWLTAGAASLVALFAADSLSPSNPPDVFVTSAAARGGRPVTPMSYAGAASRTARPNPNVAARKGGTPLSQAPPKGGTPMSLA